MLALIASSMIGEILNGNYEVKGNLTVDGTCTGCSSGGSVNTSTIGYSPYYSGTTAISGANVTGAVKAGNPPTQAGCSDLSDAVSSCNHASGILASSYVATSEATTSTSFTGLSTADTITFSLAATTNVIVRYMAYMSPSTGSGQSCVTQLNVDTSDVTATALFAGLNGGNSDPTSNEYKTSLGSGSHTILMKYKVTSNGCNWFNRLLTAEVAP
jgi:hypothetical protein